MAEYIERSEAIEFIKHNTPNINGETTVKCVIRSLKNVPTADVAEVKHGKWIDNHNVHLLVRYAVAKRQKWTIAETAEQKMDGEGFIKY